MAMPTSLAELTEVINAQINYMLNDRTRDNFLDIRIAANLTEHLRENLPKATEDIVAPALVKLSAELRAEHAQMMTQMEGQVNIVKQVVADQDQQLKSAIEELKLIKASTTTMSEQVDLRKTEMDTQMQAADSKLDELRIAQAQAIASLATHVDTAFAGAQGELDSHVAQIVAHCETQLAQIREDVDRSVVQGA